MKKNKTPRLIRDVRSKTLLYYLLFSMILLAVLWLSQVVFLSTLYEDIKAGQIRELGKQIAAEYGSGNYQFKLDNFAYQNELKIAVFKVVNGEPVQLYSAGAGSIGGNPQIISTGAEYNKFINSFGGASSSSYVNAESQGRKTLTYGEIKEVDGEYIYFYINASIIPVESTTRILTIQLMAVTVLCFVLAVFISLIMSKQLSDPIVSLTKSAERLAQGDFSVKFEGKGYNEIDKLSDTLNYATEELQKTENFRKDILANVSHELRTPLTMIKAYAEMIQDISGENPDKRNKHLQVIIEESERLKILVNDILDLSKLQAGVEQYVKAPFNLSLAVERIAAAFSGSFAKSGYSFKTDVAEGIEINCDGKRIEQVIYNLIANAVNYSGDDKRITVKLIKEEWGAIFSVSDRGYGIPADSIPTIFDRFFTGKHSKRPVTGSGIGLSLVKSILTAHNYDYGVESRENEGSTFYVVFKPYTVTE